MIFLPCKRSGEEKVYHWLAFSTPMEGKVWGQDIKNTKLVRADEHRTMPIEPSNESIIYKDHSGTIKHRPRFSLIHPFKMFLAPWNQNWWFFVRDKINMLEKSPEWNGKLNEPQPDDRCHRFIFLYWMHLVCHVFWWVWFFMILVCTGND